MANFYWDSLDSPLYLFNDHKNIKRKNFGKSGPQLGMELIQYQMKFNLVKTEMLEELTVLLHHIFVQVLTLNISG